MSLKSKIKRHRFNAKLRRIRYQFISRMPARLQLPINPSKEMLEQCGKDIGDNTYLYRLCEYYVDPTDGEVSRVVYRR